VKRTNALTIYKPHIYCELPEYYTVTSRWLLCVDRFTHSRKPGKHMMVAQCK